MPTYEYSCRACGEHVEVVQSFRDEPLSTCGLCGGSMRKVFSAAGIIFKGSGYYVTDTRKKAKSESSGSSSSDSGSSSDTKKADTAKSA
jgi:putative FmdB family regulatory protein